MCANTLSDQPAPAARSTADWSSGRPAKPQTALPHPDVTPESTPDCETRPEEQPLVELQQAGPECRSRGRQAHLSHDSGRCAQEARRNCIAHCVIPTAPAARVAFSPGRQWEAACTPIPALPSLAPAPSLPCACCRNHSDRSASMAVVPARKARPDLGVPFVPEPRLPASGTLFSAAEAPASPAELVSAHAREQTRCRSAVDRAMASCETVRHRADASFRRERER